MSLAAQCAAWVSAVKERMAFQGGEFHKLEKDKG